MRFATIRECDLYFRWANDPTVRANSFSIAPIKYEQHVEWFRKQLLNEHCFMYFFSDQGTPAGQVRIEIQRDETIIGVSVDSGFRGRSLGETMIKKATGDFLRINEGQIICAYIKQENSSSIKAFARAGYKQVAELQYNDSHTIKMIFK